MSLYRHATRGYTPQLVKKDANGKIAARKSWVFKYGVLCMLEFLIGHLVWGA